MCEKAIYARLAADVTILGIVSTSAIDFDGDPSNKYGVRIYPDDGPPTPLFPAIRYKRIGDDPEFHLGGQVGVLQATIEIHCWSKGDDYAGAKALAAAVRDSLNGVGFTAGGITVQGCFKTDERDEGTKRPATPQEVKFPRVIQQYDVWCVE